MYPFETYGCLSHEVRFSSFVESFQSGVEAARAKVAAKLPKTAARGIACRFEEVAILRHRLLIGDVEPADMIEPLVEEAKCGASKTERGSRGTRKKKKG